MVDKKINAVITKVPNRINVMVLDKKIVKFFVLAKYVAHQPSFDPSLAAYLHDIRSCISTRVLKRRGHSTIAAVTSKGHMY